MNREMIQKFASWENPRLKLTPRRETNKNTIGSVRYLQLDGKGYL